MTRPQTGLGMASAQGLPGTESVQGLPGTESVQTDLGRPAGLRTQWAVAAEEANQEHLDTLAAALPPGSHLDGQGKLVSELGRAAAEGIRHLGRQSRLG